MQGVTNKPVTAAHGIGDDSSRLSARRPSVSGSAAGSQPTSRRGSVGPGASAPSLAQVQAAAVSYLHSLQPGAQPTPGAAAAAHAAATSSSALSAAADPGALGLADLADEDDLAFHSFRRSLAGGGGGATVTTGAGGSLDFSALGGAPPSAPQVPFGTFPVASSSSSSAQHTPSGSGSQTPSKQASARGNGAGGGETTPRSARPSSAASPRSTSTSAKKKHATSRALTAAPAPAAEGSTTPRTHRKNPFLMDSKPSTAAGGVAALSRSGHSASSSSVAQPRVSSTKKPSASVARMQPAATASLVSSARKPSAAAAAAAEAWTQQVLASQQQHQHQHQQQQQAHASQWEQQQEEKYSQYPQPQHPPPQPQPHPHPSPAPSSRAADDVVITTNPHATPRAHPLPSPRHQAWTPRHEHPPPSSSASAMRTNQAYDPRAYGGSSDVDLTAGGSFHRYVLPASDQARLDAQSHASILAADPIPFALPFQSPMPQLTSHPLYAAPPAAMGDPPAPLPALRPDPYLGEFARMSDIARGLKAGDALLAPSAAAVRLPREKQEEIWRTYQTMMLQWCFVNAKQQSCFESQQSKALSDTSLVLAELHRLRAELSSKALQAARKAHLQKIDRILSRQSQLAAQIAPALQQMQSQYERLSQAVVQALHRVPVEGIAGLDDASLAGPLQSARHHLSASASMLAPHLATFEALEASTQGLRHTVEREVEEVSALYERVRYACSIESQQRALRIEDMERGKVQQMMQTILRGAADRTQERMTFRY